MNETKKPLDGFEEINLDKRYKEMVENLYFDPTPGKHKVICRSNLMEKSYFDPVTGSQKTDFAVVIEENGKVYVWSFCKGKTASRYGQILEIQKKLGDLNNVKLEIIVKMAGETKEGKPKRDYTILEA